MALDGTSLVALRETKTEVHTHLVGSSLLEGLVSSCITTQKGQFVKASKSGRIKLWLLFRFWTEEGSDDTPAKSQQ